MSDILAAANSLATSPGGTTALHRCETGEEVEALVKLGLVVDAKTTCGQTPLHHACMDGNLGAAMALLKHGADVNAKSSIGRTPLRHACERDYLNIAEALLKHGADVNAEDARRWTPLHIACERGYHEVAQLLLKHGADVNAKSSSGLTPLDRCKTDKMKALFATGASTPEDSPPSDKTADSSPCASDKTAFLYDVFVLTGNLAALKALEQDLTAGQYLSAADVSRRVHYANETGDLAMQQHLRVFQRLDSAESPAWAASQVTPHLIDVFMYLAEAGELKALKVLHQTHKFTSDNARHYDNRALREAAMHGHMSVCRWLKETFALERKDVRVKYNNLLSFLIETNQLDMCVWLTEEFGLTAEDARDLNCYGPRNAARHGNLGACQWAHAAFGLTAANYGNSAAPNVAEWLKTIPSA